MMWSDSAFIITLVLVAVSTTILVLRDSRKNREYDKMDAWSRNRVWGVKTVDEMKTYYNDKKTKDK